MAFDLCLEKWDGFSGGHKGGEARITMEVRTVPNLRGPM